MRSVTGSMANVVKGMDGAMKSMDLEKVGPSFSISVAGGYRTVSYHHHRDMHRDN